MTNGTKQGCVLAPLLISIFFAMVLDVAYSDCQIGIPIQFHTDGDIFNNRRLQAKTKTLKDVIRELVYADDCVLVAHAVENAQELLDQFSKASKRFGLTISLKKTEVMHQTFPTSSKADAELLCDDQPLKVTDSFCYLGSILSRDVSLDKEIDARLAKANAAFGALRRRLWNEHGIRLDTKIAVYKAVVLTTLPYGSET